MSVKLRDEYCLVCARTCVATASKNAVCTKPNLQKALVSLANTEGKLFAMLSKVCRAIPASSVGSLNRALAKAVLSIPRCKAENEENKNVEELNKKLSNYGKELDEKKEEFKVLENVKFVLSEEGVKGYVVKKILKLFVLIVENVVIFGVVGSHYTNVLD